MTLTDADLDRIEARVWAETVGRDPVTRINEATSVLDLSVPRLEQVHADVCSLVAEVRRQRARIDEASAIVETASDERVLTREYNGLDMIALPQYYRLIDSIRATLASAGDAGREGE